MGLHRKIVGAHLRRCDGFTLVELMVAIALAAATALYAAPAFDQWRMRERVDARSRTLLGAVSFAAPRRLGSACASRCAAPGPPAIACAPTNHAIRPHGRAAGSSAGSSTGSRGC